MLLLYVEVALLELGIRGNTANVSGRERVIVLARSNRYAIELNLVVVIDATEGESQSNEIVMAVGYELEMIVDVTKVEVNEGELVCMGKSQVGVRIKGRWCCRRFGLL